MKNEIALQKAQIADQQEELRILCSRQEDHTSMEVVKRQSHGISMSRETIHIQQKESQAAAETVSTNNMFVKDFAKRDTMCKKENQVANLSTEILLTGAVGYRICFFVESIRKKKGENRQF